MKKVFLHPTPIRIWHWTNAGLIFLLIITGIQLRFPRVSIFHYNHAVFLHKIFGFVLVGSFLYWLTYYLNYRRAQKALYVPQERCKRHDSPGLLLYFLHVQGHHEPFHSFSVMKGLILCRR